MSWINSKVSQQSDSNDKGQMMEIFAEQHLSKQGLLPLERNVHCRQGELDLIMKDGDTFVFVEVKYRKNKSFGGAICSITQSKKKKIKHCIAYFFNKNDLNPYNTPCRVDIVALDGDITHPQVTWLKNAF